MEKHHPSARTEQRSLNVNEYNKLYYGMRERILRQMTNSQVDEISVASDDSSESSHQVSPGPSESPRSKASSEDDKSEYRPSSRVKELKEKRYSSLPALNATEPIRVSTRSSASEGHADLVNTPKPISDEEKRLRKLRLQAVRGQLDSPGVASGWRLVDLREKNIDAMDEHLYLAAMIASLSKGSLSKDRLSKLSTSADSAKRSVAPPSESRTKPRSGHRATDTRSASPKGRRKSKDT